MDPEDAAAEGEGEDEAAAAEDEEPEEAEGAVAAAVAAGEDAPEATAGEEEVRWCVLGGKRDERCYCNVMNDVTATSSRMLLMPS